MSIAHWDQRLLLGVPTLDDHHRRLFRIAHSIDLAIERRDSSDNILRLIRNLNDFSDRQFETEEYIMETDHYPLRVQHKEAHTKLTKLSYGIQKQFEDERNLLVLVLQLHSKIIIGMRKHILEEDVLLADFINAVSV